MAVSSNMNMSFILPALFVVVFSFSFIRVRRAAARLFTGSRARGRKVELPRSPMFKASFKDEDAATLAVLEEERNDAQFEEMQLYKDLYFKLQNLEQYPEILPQSRDLLISLFSETLTEARKKPKSGILSIQLYTPESLASFLQKEDDRTAQQWEQYLVRRKAQGPLELFKDREEAKWWLKQVAPVKFVDGAWLGHINKITTPFALRRTSKNAWQVLSEELGDGDPNKNHVYIYRELMKEIEPDLPEGDTADFIHPRHKLDEPVVWKAAVAQLLISLFPHQFLPEILGFNMQFEGITLETLNAAKELKEVKLNPYYFILHISIDNADSGHTAMAMHTVVKYIEHVQRTQGDGAAEKAWKRVQTGFVLSAGLSTTADCPSRRKSAVGSFPRNECEAEVIKIFKAKASVSQKIHCSSGMKIGRRTLVDWLDPEAFNSKQWQMDFLNDLSNLKSWVRKGDSSKSKLIQELSWEGKMFGSFTQIEVEIVERWIESLGDPDPRLYWSFTGQTEVTSDQFFQHQDICVDYPVFSPISSSQLLAQPTPASTMLLPTFSTTAKITLNPNMAKLLPLWFTHPCLLESFISIPAKTTTKTASAIIRLLRAQSSFGAEGPGVAGMDEVRRTESVGLVELGLEMVQRSELREPGSLEEVLASWPSEPALTMLHLSMRPMRNAALLLGMARAFVGLHDAMASSPLLSAASREVLTEMTHRERDSLNICVEELKGDEIQYADFCRGYSVSRMEIESCFE